MNLASRLQSAAPPGGTLISHDTYRYVRGVFDMTPRPPLTVKGKSEPLQTYLVRRAKPRPFRNVARGVAGIEIRTIGREQEMQALQSAYLRAYEGHGMVWAQLISDPGVGKSRLLEDMRDWIDLRDETTRLFRARSFPDDVDQPFALVRRMWFDRFQIAEDAPLEQAEARWVERFKEFSDQEDSDEAAHALGLLVGLSFQNSPDIKGMRNDPNQVKGRAFVVSQELVRAVRKQCPMVVLLEDLQWTDFASWEYLMEVFLAETDNEQPNGLFVLGASRPEWQPPSKLMTLFEASSATGQITHTEAVKISLAPLSDQAIRELSRELLQRVADVPAEVTDLLVERSEGVPYFTEEMINWFIDHAILDTHNEPWRFLPEKLKTQPLPSTLQHLLLTRLSTLSQPERVALQRGAIFGRRFWTGGVEALGVLSGEETLAHLRPRGFVEVQPESSFQGDTEWSFHHNLLQQVTYESVLKRERAALHKVAAGWLEGQARQANRVDEFAGLLGDHYERAGELSVAVDWYMLAGEHAFSQGALHEASNFYTRALELLPPVDKDRRWQALLGRESAHSVLTEAGPWKADVNLLLELARSFEDDNYLAEAYLRQTICAMRTGDEELSQQACQVALSTSRKCGNEIVEIKALVLTAVTGIVRSDKSPILKDNVDEALKRARLLGDENLLAFVLARASFYYGEFEVDTSYELLMEEIELEHRLGNRIQEASSMGNLGGGYIGVGLYKRGRQLIEQSNQICKSLGLHRALGYHLGNLGEMYINTGELGKAHQYLEQALQEVTPSQDTRGIAFILMDLGNVMLAMGDIVSASRYFAEELELASSHGLLAKVSEAKIGLAACALMQGQLEQAKNLNYEGWNYLKEHGWVGMTNVGWVVRTCTETFEALDELETAHQVIEYAYKELLELANTLNIPGWRKSFLENLPDHRWIVEMWERQRR